MAYTLHIERDHEVKRITKKEWLEFLKTDVAFEMVQKYSIDIENGKKLTIQTPNSGLFRLGEYRIPFIFSEGIGKISVTRPNDLVIEKMISVAKQLNAVVRGDEGEIYDESYLKEKINSSKTTEKKTWWKFWS